MNKQELIKHYEDMSEKLHVFPVVAISRILEDLRQLDEPQKVVVPQFVADWIERERKAGGDLEDLFDDIVCEQQHLEWFREEENMNLVARAWLDGYTVEKEKRYLVTMKGKIEENVLTYGNNIFRYFFTRESTSGAVRIYHTRKELEESGFGWVFDCPGIEIEEVECE